MCSMAAKILDEPIEDKIEHIEKTVVQWPFFIRIMDKIKECHERSKISSEPRCLLIIGGTGDGKTTVGEYYLKQHERRIDENGTTAPVLYLSIPANATVKGFASRLLEDLGDPLHDRGTTINMTSRLCRLIKACKVELIIMDEFQHLIHGDSDRVLHSTADWLKDILNRTKVPIILMGLPNSKRILKANDQLMRRFSAIFELRAFKWTPLNERNDFLKFLMMMEKEIPMPKPSHIYTENMAFRIFCATKGKICNVKKLLSKAAQRTYEKGFECITIEVLAIAYEEELEFTDPSSPNPFLSEYESLKLPTPSQSSQSSAEKKGTRGKRKNKHHSQSIAEVLHR